MTMEDPMPFNGTSQEASLSEAEKAELLEKLNTWIEITENGLRAEYPRKENLVESEKKRLKTLRQLKMDVEAGKTKDAKGVDIREAIENAINKQ